MRRSDSSLRAVLAKNVRQLRNGLKISQESLADEAGLHRTYVGSIERAERNISVDNIEKLARALRCEPGRFFVGWRR
ncbi:MAG: helix-turn-helix transcriptional regulator [Hyphomicrobiales bacterium]|nr:helix-turn-helix transcriptional regulator [Hyphomicrobiales bacterium]